MSPAVKRPPHAVRSPLDRLAGEGIEERRRHVAELAPRPLGLLGEDPEGGELPQEGQSRRPGDVEPALHEPRGQDRVLRHDLDQPRCVPRCDRRGALPVVLSELEDALGPVDGVDRLRSHSLQEQGEPGLDVARLSRRLERLVVALPIPFEVRAQVQQRGRQPAACAQEEDDGQATQAPVAIEEGVEGLELVVQQCALHEDGQLDIGVGEVLPVGEQVRELIRRRGTNRADSIVESTPPIQFWVDLSSPGVRSRPLLPERTEVEPFH